MRIKNCSKKFEKTIDPCRSLCEIGTAHGKKNNNTTMKKTLLIAAAALAASVISSQAQVYSQNIVGYVNTPIVNGYTILSNPLDNSANNNITNLIDIVSGNYDGANVYVWNGGGYTVYTLDSGQPTLVGNSSDTLPVTGPVIPAGVSVYINNNTGIGQTNTFVGTVHVDGAAAGTNVVGFTTNNLPTGQFFYSSKLPIGGGLGSVLGLPVLSGALDGATVYIPNISGSPTAVHGYTAYTCDSGQLPSGFGNSSDTIEVPEPVIPVGGGFVLNNNTGLPVQWIQSF